MYSDKVGEKSMLRIIDICIILGLIILLSFTASASLHHLDSIRVGQIKFFTSGILVVGGFFMCKLLVDNSISFTITIIDLILIIFILYVGLDCYLGQNTRGFSLRLIEFFGLSTIYIYLRCRLTFYPYFLLACVLGCIIQSLYGLIQLYGFYPSNNENFLITGSFLNPGPLAGYILYGFCVSIGLYLFKDSITNKASLKAFFLSKKSFDILFLCFVIGGMICCFLSLLACKSRASWLGMILCCALLVYKSKRNNLWKKFSLKSKVYILVIAGIIFLLVIISLYFINKDSGNGRLLAWKITTEIIAENHLMGVGFDNFSSKYMSHQARYFEKSPLSYHSLVAGDIKYPFNIFMVYLAENGFIGFIFVMIILVRVFSIKETDSITIISKAALLGQLIFAFFSYSEQILSIKINIVCSLVLLASKDNKFFSYQIKKFQFNLIKYLILLGYLIYSIYFTFYIDKIVRSYKNWEIGSKLCSSGQFPDAIAFFSSAYPCLKKNGEFLMQYGNALLKADKTSAALNAFNKAERYFNNYPLQIMKGNCFKKLNSPDLAMISYRNASNMVPSRLYPKYLQAIYYLELNRKESAIIQALIILRMHIKINSPAVDEIKAKMDKIVTNQNLNCDEILSLLNRTSGNSANEI